MATAVDEVAVVAAVGHGEQEVVHGEVVDAVVLVAHAAVVDVALAEAVRDLLVVERQSTVTGQLREHVHEPAGRRVRIEYVQIGWRQRYALPLADGQRHVRGERRQDLVERLDGDAEDPGARAVLGVGDVILERILRFRSGARVAVEDGLRRQVQLAEGGHRVAVRPHHLAVTWRWRQPEDDLVGPVRVVRRAQHVGVDDSTSAGRHRHAAVDDDQTAVDVRDADLEEGRVGADVRAVRKPEEERVGLRGAAQARVHVAHPVGVDVVLREVVAGHQTSPRGRLDVTSLNGRNANLFSDIHYALGKLI